uniref:EF-hand domain-containing protein n=1 Tax=Entomoneis paludosa TaxID=265537 RepID=A0A7S2VFZ2_9STRA|mmetsp:Transcript_1868/g.3938  ORF Transcript_1868/g.3938 Transcript_1868/m.3938 type:complete len:194 (+) Transcript_1868:310-891(+)
MWGLNLRYFCLLARFFSTLRSLLMPSRFEIPFRSNLFVLLLLDIFSLQRFRCSGHIFPETHLIGLFLPISGTIELHELQQVMHKLGQSPTKSELQEMIQSVDDNGDGEIDFDEFLILMKSRIGSQDADEELKEAFRVFDTDDSGEIDKKELKRLMKKLGQKLSEAELDAMMAEVDTNGDGVISFEEFKALMTN